MEQALAVTLGEPAGIGPDIAITAWAKRNEFTLPPFYIIGDPDLLKRRAHQLSIDLHLDNATPQDAAERFANALPVLDLGLRASAEASHPDETSAPLVIAAIRRAVSDVQAGHAMAVVTNPIAKSVLYNAGFKHPGHTEFLAELAAHDGVVPRPVMMLWSTTLAVVPVTIHVALRDAIARLTTEEIVETGRIVARDLQDRFGMIKPRIAVSGLNPHAGEDGSLGVEDRDIIAPAVARLRSEGIEARGPLPADTMFHEAARRTYDCALCMYHDQALIPIKALAFDDAVNVTLGLPFVRTSPDHGTAFDIAGTGRANPSSFIAALRLAARMANAVATSNTTSTRTGAARAATVRRI